MTWVDWIPLACFALLGLGCVIGAVVAMAFSERPPRCTDADGCWGEEEHR